MAKRGDSESPFQGDPAAATMPLPVGGDSAAERLAARLVAGEADVETIVAVADAVPVMIAYCDRHQRYVFANQPIADWFERPRETILGKSLREVMGEAAYAARREAIERALAGERQRLTAEFDHPTRGPLVTHADYIPHFRDGRQDGLILVVQDVTEQHAAEAAIRESEARFRQIADSTPTPIWVSRADGSRDFVNQAYLDFFGLDADAARHHDWLGCVDPADRAAAVERLRVGQQSGLPFELVGRFRNHAGEWRWLQVNAHPRRDGEGRIIGYNGVATDITAAKLAEFALRDQVADGALRLQSSEARFHAIFDASLEMIGLLELDGSYIDVNQAALDSLGLSMEELRGRKPWEIDPFLDHPDSCTALERLVRRAARGETAKAEIAMTAGGNRLSILVSMKPVVGADGKPLFLVGEGRDITDLKLAQEQLRQSQKMEALGQLTGGIAHDFNNLLTVVVGGLDLITKRVEDESILRYARNALAAAERGARLTGQLLAFSRVQRLEVRPTEVKPLIDEMRPLLRNVLGPTIDKNFDLADQPMAVMVDPTQLEVAILNLAINARDAMPEGGTLSFASRAVRIDDDPEMEAGDYVELAISDNGSGMPPDVAARAFEPFFTTKDVGKGTGLGLSMVYGMARQSGGTARIESEAGKGTTVRLFFRQADIGDDVATTHADYDPADRDEAAPARILVIDDDPDVREFIVSSLSEFGYETVEAVDGEAGLQRFEEAAPDVVVVDYVMPGLSGADVAAAIRSRRPDQPLLFVSGYNETDTIRTAAPDAALLAKPFRPAALASAIRDLLRPAAE